MGGGWVYYNPKILPPPPPKKTFIMAEFPSLFFLRPNIIFTFLGIYPLFEKEINFFFSGIKIQFSDLDTDPGLYVLTCERYSKYHLISFLDNLQVLFLYFNFLCETFHRCPRSRKPTRIWIR